MSDAVRIANLEQECDTLWARLDAARDHIRVFVDGQGSRSFRQQAVYLATEQKRLRAAVRDLRELLLDIQSLVGCGTLETAQEAIKDGLDVANAALAKNPNPSGHLSAEASVISAAEASGPVGLGPSEPHRKDHGQP